MRKQHLFLLAVTIWLTCHVSSACASSQAIAFSTDSKTLAIASGGFVALIDVQSGKQIGDLSQPVGSDCLAFSPDGKILVVGTSGDGIRKKSEIWIWDVAKRQVLLKRITSDRNLSELVFSPDGHTLVTGSQNKACLWDTQTWQIKSTLKEGISSRYCFAFSPDGNYLVVGNCHSWKSIDYLNERASAGGLELWDMKKLQLKHTFQKDVDAIYTVAFSPDGQTIASGGIQIGFTPNRDGNYGVVRLWDVRTGSLKRTLRQKWEVSSTRFSPDSKTLVIGCALFLYTDPIRIAEGGEVGLWDLKTERFRKQKQYKGGVWDVVLSPDGSTLAVLRSGGNIIELWNASMTKILHTL